jgi:hypothetical protein
MVASLAVLLAALVQSPTDAGAARGRGGEGPVYRIVATLDESAGILSAHGVFIVWNNAAAPRSTVAVVVPPAARVDELKVQGAALSPVVTGDTLHILLASPLVPGDSAVIEIAWSAHPRHHHGREFTFAAWQPRVSQFARVSLLLYVPADQVVSASGTAFCGNPGWSPDRSLTDRMTWRGAGTPTDNPVTQPPCRPSGTNPGRKMVGWRADNVAEVALALSPDFRYEEGDVLGFPMRAFYRTADAQAWGSGVAASHLETSFAWLNEIFGDYPWPQATIVRTPAAPDTVVAMQIWSERPDQLQLMRALGHMYTRGLVSLPNPADAWLDEGLAGFQTTWYLEEEGIRRPTAQLERDVLMWDLDGVSQPIAQPREAFHDSATANAMIARRGELFLHVLRAIVGDTLRGAFHWYFAENRFREVSETTFRAAVERASGMDLRATFDQWLRGTSLVDYGVNDAQRHRTATGWRTDVRVSAHGPARFPVTVWVLTDADTGVARIAGREPQEQVTIVTHGRPWRVLLDPEGQSYDWNALNDQYTFGLRFGRDRPTARYFDGYFRRRSEHDRVTVGIAPIAWRTDRDGWTVGLRRRDDYLERFELNEMIFAATTGWDVPSARVIPQLSIGVRNPVSWRAAGWGQRVAGFLLDGRAGATIGVERSRQRSVATLPHHAVGLEFSWLNVMTRAAVDSIVYDKAGTLELTATARASYASRPWHARVAIGLTGGYQHPKVAVTGGPGDGAFGRLTALATAHSDSAAVFRLGLRLYAGRTFSRMPLVRQRLIYLAGADPYERMTSPFLRSPGALLERPDIRYHAPGGAGMRGLDPRLATAEAYGASLEIDGALWRRGGTGGMLARRASLALFADGALANGGAGWRALQSIAEAGFGIRLDHRLGSTAFQTRWDFPIWISRPELAQDRRPGTRQVGWRWVFSFSPAF